ncbi:alpha/beta hydrolase [Chlamydia sp. 17-3921]|uniref:alpha/beta hydrolase n=1 Tax=Chlamydia sp. 17-3921 TaxID=2675798 RepID=UPI00191B2F98|nr:alpha/beta hydrolase [Chlamydia sp. 17-3921]
MTKYSFFRRNIAGIDVIECPGNPKDPVIILCHGYGATADNLTFFPSVCVFANMRPTWIFPNGIERLPQNLDYGRAWFPLDVPLFESLISDNSVSPTKELKYKQLFDIDLERPKEAIENLIASLNRPFKEIFIGGFSQGAILTTHLVLTSQNAYGGALILSGARLFNKGWETGIQTCADVPYLQSHGFEDAILPYFLGTQLQSLLSEKLHGEFVSFSGGHEIGTSVLQKMQEFVPFWANYS